MEISEKNRIFSWLHLSDLHFGHGNAEVQADRRKILKEMASKIKELDGSVDAIFITGDISSSSKNEEFSEATNWLNDISGGLGITSDSIFIVPGNHDIDASEVEDNPNLRRLHNSVCDERDSVDDIFTNKLDSKLLATKFRNYFDFSSQFGKPKKTYPEDRPPFYWKHSINTSSGYKIRIFGLNTALISQRKEKKGQLFVGKSQLEILPTTKEKSKCVSIVLSHHPLTWLSSKDENTCKNAIRNSSHIHVHGHEHRVEVALTQYSSGGKHIKISSPAGHDGQIDDDVTIHEHGYQICHVSSENNKLVVIIEPYKWNKSTQNFRLNADIMPENKEEICYELGSVSIIDGEKNGSINEAEEQIKIKNEYGNSPVGNADNSIKPKDKHISPKIISEPLLENSSSSKNKFGETVKSLIPDFFQKVRYKKISEDKLKEIKGTVREPNFMLLRRADKIILVITDGFSRIMVDHLQKTNEPKTNASLLKIDEVKQLGFHDGKVHPLFLDRKGLIHRVIIDAPLLAQIILSPSSKIILPIYSCNGSEYKITSPIKETFDYLTNLYGRKRMVYANVSKYKGCDSILKEIIFKQSISTRFAPTPSAQLHIGNARTAVITYLFYLSAIRYKDANFYIRFDDTDSGRAKSNLEQPIREDLHWLGIEWNKSNEFRQTDFSRRSDHDRYLELLEVSKLIEGSGSEKVSLKRYPDDTYKNIYFCWRKGPIIEHKPPVARDEQEKLIFIKRENSGSYLYRFAGLIDDIKLSTHIFRDDRQIFLTKVQSHIRAMIELSINDNNNEISLESTSKNKGEVSLSALNLPIYFHVQRVIDENGEALNKRGSESQFHLSYLRQDRNIFPEGVLAYILSTILFKKGTHSKKKYIRDIATMASVSGCRNTLKYYAEYVDFDELMVSGKPLVANSHDLDFANKMVLHSIPCAKFVNKLSKELAVDMTGFGSKERELAEKIHLHRENFKNWNEILCFCNGPEKSERIDKISFEIIREIMQKNSGEQLRQALTSKINYLRNDENSIKGEGSLLANFQKSIRLVITGLDIGPCITILLDMIDDSTLKQRFVKVLQ